MLLLAWTWAFAAERLREVAYRTEVESAVQEQLIDAALGEVLAAAAAFKTKAADVRAANAALDAFDGADAYDNEVRQAGLGDFFSI